MFGLNNALAKLDHVQLRVLSSDAAGPSLSCRLAVSVTEPTRYPQGYDVYFCRRVLGSEIAPRLLSRLLGLVRWADVIHLTAAYSFSTLPTLLVCRLLGKPVVWSPRGALLATHEWQGARRRSLKLVWDQLCNAIVTGGRCVLHVTSEQERMASLARIPHVSARVIRNGVDFPIVLPQREWCPGGRMRLIFIGRLDPQKGIENLLNALGLLRGEELSLEICGTGEATYVQELKALVKQLRLDKRVEFVGHVNAENRFAAFMRADLCVTPSHKENFAMVVAEALAHGVPVIASTGTPWRGVIERGCGAWVDNSPETLASAIHGMRYRPLAEFGQRGRCWMGSDFSWEVVAEEMYELYKSICATT